MLSPQEITRAVNLQQRSYRLLKWMADAVSKGFINFDTAHDYSSVPEATEKWILRHYDNIPPNARPGRSELPEFCAMFSTYLTNSFVLVREPGKQLYSPDAHCFCPLYCEAFGVGAVGCGAKRRNHGWARSPGGDGHLVSGRIHLGTESTHKLRP